MKKLFVDSKGNVLLKEVREPFIETKGLLVKTAFSLISSGTELASIQAAKLTNFSLIGILKNFIKSKDFRKRFFEETKGKNLKTVLYFYKSLAGKGGKKNFRSPSINLTPLGYSSSGIVQKSNIEKYRRYGRVACVGSSHAELIFSPKNLSCIIPDNVSFEEAAFVALGAIALHSIHRANIKPGEYIGIIGVGLIGLLTVQLAKIFGARVFAFDLINKRLNLAKKLGADFIINPLHYDSLNKVNAITQNQGLDSIIICAASKNPKPLEDAVDLIRENGKIVILGAFPISIDRSKLYYKEADLLISRSYGYGRYDPYYEYYGFDYPKNVTPWTVQRNMELFLKLISEKKIDVKSLISDIIPVEKAEDAYNRLFNDPINNLAILLKFSKESSILEEIQLQEKVKPFSISKKLIIGLIGCGMFPQAFHLPHLISNPNCKIKGICTQHKNTANICKEKYRPDYVTTNYKKILKDPEIDTVFIYTRHDTHAKIAIEAIKAKKNVFVEKPMGLTLEQCKNVYATTRNSKCLYIIGFNRRFSPLIKIAKELLKNRSNPIIIHYRIANNFIPGNHWIFDSEIGGGPIIGEFCHFTDLILYLIESEPTELIAKGGNLSHRNLNTYDSCTVLIKFLNGSIANLIYTDLNGPEMSKERIEIFSGESSIIIDDFKTMMTSGFDIGNKFLDVQDKGHKDEMISVIKANLGMMEPLVNVEDAFKAMILCFKTIESIKQNKTIELKIDFEE